MGIRGGQRRACPWGLLREFILVGTQDEEGNFSKGVERGLEVDFWGTSFFSGLLPPPDTISFPLKLVN